jgi:hypothetical protein
MVVSWLCHSRAIRYRHTDALFGEPGSVADRDEMREMYEQGVESTVARTMSASGPGRALRADGRLVL